MVLVDASIWMDIDVNIYPAYQPATGHVAMSLNVLVVPNTNKHYKDVSKFGRTRKPSTNISFQTIFYMITIYRYL